MKALGWLSSVVVGAALGATLGVVTAVRVIEPAGVVEAREIRVVDASGKPRAGLGVSEDGPRLPLWDAAGKVRAGLAVDEDGPELVLFDAADSKSQARLRLRKDTPSLSLWDAAGQRVWSAP